MVSLWLSSKRNMRPQKYFRVCAHCGTEMHRTRVCISCKSMDVKRVVTVDRGDHYARYGAGGEIIKVMKTGASNGNKK